MNLDNYDHFELHMSEPRIICIFEKYEVLENINETVHFYSGSSFRPFTSMYIDLKEICHKHISGSVYRLASSDKFQLLGKIK